MDKETAQLMIDHNLDAETAEGVKEQMDDFGLDEDTAVELTEVL